MWVELTFAHFDLFYLLSCYIRATEVQVLTIDTNVKSSFKIQLQFYWYDVIYEEFLL